MTKREMKKNLSKSRQMEPSSQGRQVIIPVKSTSLRSRNIQGNAKKARRRRQSRATEVSNPYSDANDQRGPSRASLQQQNHKIEEADGMNNREHQGCAKWAFLGFSRNQMRNRRAWPLSIPLGKTAEKPEKEKIEVVRPCTF